MLKLIKRQFGFTIVELLVVIVVIAILVAITIVSYNGITQRAVVASLTSDLGNASKVLKMDYVNNGIYPLNLAQANDGKGIAASPNTEYVYVTNSSISPTAFCLTATNGSNTYKITNDGSASTGDCTIFGLILSYDAGNTASYPGSGNYWYDLSENSNTGTLVNTPTYSSAGGGSLDFNGTTQYINITGNSKLEPKSITVAAWINMDTSAPTTRNIFMTKWLGYSCEIEATSRRPYFRLATVGDVYSSDNLVLGNWYYYVGTFEKNAAQKIYLNGVLKGSRSSSSDISYTANAVLNVGRYAGGIYFDGLISKVDIYNRALSEDEIEENFSALQSRYGL